MIILQMDDCGHSEGPKAHNNTSHAGNDVPRAHANQIGSWTGYQQAER